MGDLRLLGFCLLGPLLFAIQIPQKLSSFWPICFQSVSFIKIHKHTHSRFFPRHNSKVYVLSFFLPSLSCFFLSSSHDVLWWMGQLRSLEGSLSHTNSLNHTSHCLKSHQLFQTLCGRLCFPKYGHGHSSFACVTCFPKTLTLSHHEVESASLPSKYRQALVTW